jgi:hypothetical protein
MPIRFPGSVTTLRGLVVLNLATLLLVLFLGTNRGLGQGQSAPPGREEPGASKVTAQRLAMAGGTEGRLRYLEGSRPPVGTVMAFAGTWPPKKLEGGAWTERELGWLRCDGRTFAALRKDSGFGPQELDELQVALEQDGLPDYSGYFLRGVAGDASVNPDAAARTDPAKPGTVTGDHAGSVQGWATARPKVSFQTGTGEPDNPAGDDGGHSHVGKDGKTGTSCNRLVFYDGNCTTNGAVDSRVNGEEPNLCVSGVATQGPHRHTVNRGGDHETRPANAAVYWIVKFR